MTKPASDKAVKVISTGLISGAIALCLLHPIIPFPPFLESAFSVVQVVLLIHAVEGVIAAVLIFLYRQRPKSALDSDSLEQTRSLLTEHLPSSTPLAMIKGGLYVFFVGTVGLSEIIKAFNQRSINA